MQHVLKEIGRGRKGAIDLSYGQAREAAELIVDGEATPAQIGAFLVAERIKGESPEELAAFTDVFRQRIAGGSAEAVRPGLDSVGPYDGRTHSFAATIAVSAVLNAMGLPVLWHGTIHPQPPKFGVTIPAILARLGIPVRTDAALQQAGYRDTGLGYLDTELVCPPLHALRPIRKEIGLRTILNTIEKTLNPLHNPYLIMGVFHTAKLDPVAAYCPVLGYRRVMVVHGLEGSEDLPVHRPSAVRLVEGERVEALTIDPALIGAPPWVDRRTLTVDDQARLTEAVLTGQSERGYRDMVRLNAGVRLWLAGRAETWQSGAERAEAVLDDGQALNRLQAMAAWWRQHEQLSD